MGDMMTAFEPFFPPRSVVIGRASSRHGRYRRLWARVTNWLRACADYYEAAALYEELNRLSDAGFNLLLRSGDFIAHFSFRQR